MSSPNQYNQVCFHNFNFMYHKESFLIFLVEFTERMEAVQEIFGESLLI